MGRKTDVISSFLKHTKYWLIYLGGKYTYIFFFLPLFLSVVGITIDSQMILIEWICADLAM